MAWMWMLRENESRMMDRFLVWAFLSVLLYLICDPLLTTKCNFAFCSNLSIFHPPPPLFNLVGMPEAILFCFVSLEGCPQATRTHFACKVPGNTHLP